MLSKTRNSLAQSPAPGTILEPGTDPAGEGSPATTGSGPSPAELDPRLTYKCAACEYVMRVSGLGRHRVYFELTDARLEDPVMDRVCPACGHSLPGKSAG